MGQAYYDSSTLLVRSPRVLTACHMLRSPIHDLILLTILRSGYFLSWFTNVVCWPQKEATPWAGSHDMMLLIAMFHAMTSQFKLKSLGVFGYSRDVAIQVFIAYVISVSVTGPTLLIFLQSHHKIILLLLSYSLPHVQDSYKQIWDQWMTL